MPNFNCACEDDWETKTLATLRTDLMIRLGYAAMAGNPPPGMAALMDSFLQDAQDQLYRRYKAMRIGRFWRWIMAPGERYYGISDGNTVPAEITVAASGGGDFGYDSTVPYGSVSPDPWVLGRSESGGTAATVVSLTSDATSTTLVTSGAEVPAEYKTLSITTDAGVVELDLENPDSSSALTKTWNTPSFAAADVGIARSAVFLEECSTKVLDPRHVEWAGVQDLNDVWYPMIEGIPPWMYTRVQLMPGWPTRYEIRSCIEVFPAPREAYTLRIKGLTKLGAFSADADTTTIDYHPVFLLALGNAKSHYGHPDAGNIFNQVDSHIGALVAGSHGTARYVPTPRGQTEAQTPPTMKEWIE